MKHILGFFIIVSTVCLIACSPAEGNRTGHEFMPDMVHPTGYEANLFDYYYYNRWGTKEEYKSYVMPRYSVPGTVARGEIAEANATDESARMMAMEQFSGLSENSIAVTPNGSVPYYYSNTEEERLRATREIVKNPYPITATGLEHGKALYNIYCGICHGVNGDGQGYLVREEDPAKGIVAGVYPAAPANLLLDTFVNASPGRIYHAIMYGRNVMGSYADKLTFRERWEVIHYIRSLQAKTKKLEYTDAVNTFNKEAIPGNTLAATMKKVPVSTDTTNIPGSQHTGERNMNKH